MLPAAAVPLLRFSVGDAGCDNPRIEDHFPKRDVRPEGGPACHLGREVYGLARRANHVRGDPQRPQAREV